MIRTDYSDALAWARIVAAIQRPHPAWGFTAQVQIVDDPSFDGLSRDDIVRLAKPEYHLSFLFIVDQQAVKRKDHACLAVDIRKKREFRVIPSEVWGVENNLSLGNMDWTDFANWVDQSDTFRGFPIPRDR
ncbi:MAG: hypothetical protein IPK07_07860 [Deltaproteobacteria bacterium]|nr:hypothetical protein [Deltaproteobacteria bacterium]